MDVSKTVIPHESRQQSIPDIDPHPLISLTAYAITFAS